MKNDPALKRENKTNFRCVHCGVAPEYIMFKSIKKGDAATGIFCFDLLCYWHLISNKFSEETKKWLR